MLGTQKRSSDSVVAIPQSKKARNEIAAYSAKDKALLEQTVSNFL